MRAWQAIKAPFARLFDSLRRVNQQTYCGDSPDCEGLSYRKGNLNQDIPKRVDKWDSCPVPVEQGKAPENSPAPLQDGQSV